MAIKLNIQTPKRSLNKAFLKQRPLRSEIELFKNNLIKLLGKVDEIEREENQKNHVRDFLRDTYYKETNEINTKDSKDLVIHLGKSNKDKVGVIIEAKRPSNKNEMLSADKPNTKALQELVLYYLRERIEENNIDIKYCIATNIYEWYIIEASYFEKLFFRNKSFVKEYEQWRDGKKVTKDTNLFYNEIAKPFIDGLDEEINCTYFDIRDFEKTIKNEKAEDDKNLIALLKILSPFHLLKVPFADDSNKLNEKFYKELLHIIGLEESKKGGKTVIDRKEEGKRNSGSLIENAIAIIETENPLHKITEISNYGETRDDQVFNIALELCITWINRILFLKLLEGQLITYHKGDRQYRFLNSETINDFDELYKLFHQVLAKIHSERTQAIQQKYSRVPYLNSSLFEFSDLEELTIKINSLDNSETLPLINTTVLKELKKKSDRLPTLDYLFKFLDSFDFASEGTEDIQEDENKTLINASVLGKVFEKINGYKDGSIFTPGFITMYMCRQSIQLAVMEKFREKYGWNIEQFDDIKNYLTDRKSSKDILEFNGVINSLHICDPAVGSGHFLVSALNEIIFIKSKLGLLADEKGNRISDYEIVIENDELIVTDQRGDIFQYQLEGNKHIPKEAQRLQKTLFYEKQTIIENCLFGVDINPKSVLICRLRLWIELLKNAYYKEPDLIELETLPNIDINIKCGNSLLSRFPLDADLSKALKSIKYDIKAYRGFVNDYKNERNRDVKRGLQNIIDSIKSDFKTEITKSSKEYTNWYKAKGELEKLTAQFSFFEMTPKEKKKYNEDVQQASDKLKKHEAILNEIKDNKIYKNAFEWRFEFPEVLNNNGDFEGFDLVIGNPPYVYRNADIEPYKEYFKNTYFNNSGNFDLYKYFIERAIHITKANYFNSFITNSSFILQKSFERTRKYFLDNISFKILAPLGPNVFDEATVDSAVYLVQKKETENNEFDIIAPSNPNNLPETTPYKVNQQRFSLNNEFVFDYLLNDEAFKLVNRLFTTYPVLEKGFEFGVGINTGYIKSELTSDKKLDKRYHPMVPGTGISRYGSVNTVGYIMYDKEFVKSKGKLGRTLPDEKFFKEDKILVVRTRNLSIKQRIVATIDTERKFNLNRLSNIIARKGYSLYGLLGVLNSSLGNPLL